MRTCCARVVSRMRTNRLSALSTSRNVLTIWAKPRASLRSDLLIVSPNQFAYRFSLLSSNRG